MDYTDTNDDLALPKPPFRVVACLAVNGRLPLLRQTISRLYKINGCFKVICSGSSILEKRLCEELGAVYVQSENKPLAQKWNKAFMKAKEYHADAVLFVGSSDWISWDWLHILRLYVQHHDFVGVPGCHFLDIGKEMRLVNWPGYGEERKESIGIGRLLSAKLMDALDWQPLENKLDHSMDGSMKRRAESKGFKEYIYTGTGIKALSISTDQWDNKHKFDDHWTNKLPSEKIADVEGFLKEFPEAYQIFK